MPQPSSKPKGAGRIAEALEKINRDIGSAINTPSGEAAAFLTIADAPKTVELIYKMKNAMAGFVASELQPLFDAPGGAEGIEQAEAVLARYASLTSAMCALYLQVLDARVDPPFEKAQRYMLSMINHLLGSVFDFNGQTAEILGGSGSGGSVALEIDLEGEMRKFTKWFEEIKEALLRRSRDGAEGGP